MKHNKKRNTAFIYEALTRELTQALLSKNGPRRDQVVTILKEYFNSRETLHTELKLYQALLETCNIKKEMAERLIREVKNEHERLDENAIFNRQSQLIATINKTLGPAVWNMFVPNFKSLASISAIFNSNTGVKKRVLFEQALIDKMSASYNARELTEMRPLDTLTYASFIKKFNLKYSEILQEQKELLNRYITSFADDGFELRLYLNEELSRLKASLEMVMSDKPASLIETRAQEVRKYLEEFRHRDFTEHDLNRILKTQQLIEELRDYDQN